MGAEFIRRAAKTFTKRWDEGRRMLGTADLFTTQPECQAHSAPFDLAEKADLHAGDVVTVEKEGGALVARCRLSEVARIAKPPLDLLNAVERSCGIAKGTIEIVHDAAKVAEISLC
jgi:hypothetical protein